MSSELILNCHGRPFIPTLHLPLQSLHFIIQIFTLGAIKSSFIFSMLSLAAVFLFLAYRRIDLLYKMPICQTPNIHSHAMHMCIVTYSTVTNVMLFNCVPNLHIIDSPGIKTILCRQLRPFSLVEAFVKHVKPQTPHHKKIFCRKELQAFLSRRQRR